VFHCIYTPHLLYAFICVDGHLGCFRISAIVNNAAGNMGVRASFRDSAFISFAYTPRTGIMVGNHLILQPCLWEFYGRDPEHSSFSEELIPAGSPLPSTAL
uniref:Uncharacterized protein n=1 Tax=Sus scrofa TaxID=9823 RepID=A0A8D0W0A1_PIG